MILQNLSKCKKFYAVFVIVIVLIAISQAGQSREIYTVAGNGTAGFGGDGGPAVSASFNYVGGLAFDANNNLYVCDAGNSRIRKVNTAGIITTFAGDGTSSYGGDGGLATLAQIDNPHDVVFDTNGNLYISDYHNHRIRKVDPSGIITTFAGNGTPTTGGDGGPATAAGIKHPDGMGMDAFGNLYVAQGNDNIVRKISPAGIITTIAGTGNSGFNGDGIPATTANLSFPSDVACDTAGNVFIGEIFGSGRVRKINASGIINTVTGTAGISAMGINFDSQDNLFICEAYDNRVWKLNTSGNMVIVAGIGTSGFSGDGGPATAAQLNYPYALAFDLYGNLFIGDDFNNRVRKVVYSTTGMDESLDEGEVTLFPNPARHNFSLITPPGTFRVEIINAQGQLILQTSIDNNTKSDFELTQSGYYFVKIIFGEKIITRPVVICD